MATTGFKDLFSAGAGDYARYRPNYPPALFAHLAGLVKDHAAAWDCATGNGQAALGLAAHFQTVYATDGSEKQLAQAVPDSHVRYSLGTAESSGLPDSGVTLVTVAQAFHWFKHEAFYEEVRRVARAGESVLALWSYNEARIEPALDALRDELYTNGVGAYWQPERRDVEAGYRSIAVPFRELASPSFEMTASWTLADLAGYFGTWSATQAARRALGIDPVERIFPALERAWGPDPLAPKPVRWTLTPRFFAL